MSSEAIDRGRERFMDAMRADDPNALMKVLTSDVVFMPPGQEPLRGQAAVRSWHEATIAEGSTVHLELPEREVVVSGEWGIESGSFAWTLAPAGGGDPIEDRGSFITIWRRDSDGEWRVASDIWNSRS